MTSHIPENMLQDLSEFILDHTGLYFPQKKWKALNKGVASAAIALGYDVEEFAVHLLSATPTDNTMNTVVGYLTIGETYFLRDKNLFQILGDQILKGLILTHKKTDKKINIWSAGCATGEEPYSIAILIDHMFPKLKGCEITILGTDINPIFLEKAKKGIYTHWSLRETPQQIIKDYFIQTAQNLFTLIPEIKNRVRFAQLNLMEKKYALQFNLSGTADIILCRNVLMYFNDKNRKKVIKRLSERLAENGWLITGPAESGFVQAPELKTVKFANKLYHQKKSEQADKQSSVRRRAKPGTREAGYSVLKPAAANHKKDGIKNPTQDAITGDPDYDTYQRALKDYEKKDYRQSAERLSALLEKGGRNDSPLLMKSDSMVLLARSYANMGELEKAGYWCKKAIDSQKLNPETYFLQSTISQAAGDTTAAIRSLKQALYLDPEFIMARFTLGLLQQEKKPEKSRKDMLNALSLLKTKDPDEIIPYSEGMTVKRLIETIQKILKN